MSREVTLGKPVLKPEVDVTGHIIEPLDSGSVRMPSKWLVRVAILLFFMAPLYAFYSVYILYPQHTASLRDVPPAEYWSAAFSVFQEFALVETPKVILLLAISWSIKNFATSKSQKAIEALMAHNKRDLPPPYHTADQLAKLKNGVPTHVGYMSYPALPKRQTVATVVKDKNTIHYAHFRCIPEEEAWLDNFSLAMKLD